MSGPDAPTGRIERVGSVDLDLLRERLGAALETIRLIEATGEIGSYDRDEAAEVFRQRLMEVRTAVDRLLAGLTARDAEDVRISPESPDAVPLPEHS